MTHHDLCHPSIALGSERIEFGFEVFNGLRNSNHAVLVIHARSLRLAGHPGFSSIRSRIDLARGLPYSSSASGGLLPSRIRWFPPENEMLQGVGVTVVSAHFHCSNELPALFTLIPELLSKCRRRRTQFLNLVFPLRGHQLRGYPPPEQVNRPL